MSKLTAQQELFVDEYIRLRCKNATQAAINVGYSKKTASSQASQLLKETKICEYLQRRKNELIKALQQEFIFDALEAREVMHSILMNEEASDKDRIAAAKDFLDRGGFKPMEKVEHSGGIANPFAGLTTEELRRLAGVADDNN